MDHGDGEWTAVRDDATATLSRYLQFDTTNPPGDERAAAEWLAGQLAERGITQEVTLYEPADNRAAVVGRVAGSEALRPLILNHHIDVVSAEAERWTHPPFGGEVDEGYVWGRGALDTKGLGVVHLLALQRLVAQGASFRRPVIFLAVPDEETGGEQGMGWLVERHLEAWDPAWVWDEGVGGLNGFLGDAPIFAVSVAEKQIQHLRVVARGQAGHGSLPHDDNPTLTLLEALPRALRPRPMRANAVTAEMFAQLAETRDPFTAFLMRHLENPWVLRLLGPRLAASKTLNAMLRDTISLTMLQAGHQVNVIPERAEATLDCRLLPDTDPAEFRRWMEEALADERVTVEVVETSPATSVSPLDGPFNAAVRQAVAQHVPEAVVTPLQMPGGSDSRFFRARDVPAYGFAPFVLDMVEVDRVHGVDERLSVDNLELGVRIACDVIRALCVT
jgi:acetylornithine deacetylase/succinyl-diaminopimelate desuccinylase-like protein